LTLSSRESVPYSRIREALEMVGLLEEIFNLPHGLRTVLKGPSGVLSRGQAERLMIARGILMNPRLMIIDGSLDGVDENKIVTILDQLVGERSPFTVIVLTHDRAVWRHFKRRLEIHKGLLVESGQE
jgi:putative ABC transport system ATP-binding protein